MKYKALTKQEAFDENPFVEKAIRDIKIVQKTQVVRPQNQNEIQLIVNSGSGEVQGHTAFMRYVEVDEEQFAKVYLSQFAAFWELTKPAIEFLAISSHGLSLSRIISISIWRTVWSILAIHTGITSLLDSHA